MHVKTIAIIAFLAAVPETTVAENASHRSHYAGQEARDIKSLSPDDIAELTRGGGWGLAKAAELNGLPGPAHLLDMRTVLGLDPEQVAAITAIRDQMRVEAIRLGRQLIDLERDLDRNFRDGRVTPEVLRLAVAEISKVRGDLRFSHLSAH